MTEPVVIRCRACAAPLGTVTADAGRPVLTVGTIKFLGRQRLICTACGGQTFWHPRPASENTSCANRPG